MAHTMKVQMFGNFRMEFDGVPLIAEKMHKESQFNRLMQVMMHYAKTGIPKDKLEEQVIGERDMDVPHTALRVIVYKTKQKLKQLGLPGKDWIYLENGWYYWTKDIEVQEDAALLEEKFEEAQAPLSWMEEESASAREREVINSSPPDKVSEGRTAPPFLLSRMINSAESLISRA